MRFIISIHFNPSGNVTGAGGLFLQAMPGADAGEMQALEERARTLPSLGSTFGRDGDLVSFIDESFPAFGPKHLSSRRIAFFCHCQKKHLQRLLLLPPEELKELYKNGPFPVVVRCHNCNTAYRFSEHELRELYRQRYPRN